MGDWEPGGKTMLEADGLCYMIRCLGCRKLTKRQVSEFREFGFGNRALIADIQAKLRCSCGSRETAVQLMPWWRARHPEWEAWML